MIPDPDLLDRSVTVNVETSAEILKMVNERDMAVVVIDPAGLYSGLKTLGFDRDYPPRYFDLAAAEPGDYSLIARTISRMDIDGRSGVIFDNIDRIPEGDDYDMLCQLVKDAVRRDYANEGLDFHPTKVAARCAELPGYLRGSCTGAYYITVE